jgi:ferric-dicitrate binding protein FerR (iron transport regulator)
VPGQQAQQAAGKKIKVVDNVDLYPIISWKDEMFVFHNTTLEKIMREITRWYNVGVVYKDSIPDSYTVSVSKKLPLSQLLRSIENSGGVHFEIRNKEVIITK